MKILLIQTNYPGFLDDFHKNYNLNSLSYKKIKKLWADQLFGSGNFYLNSLKDFGWNGDEVIINDWIMQTQWLKEHSYNIPSGNYAFLNLIPNYIKNKIGLNKWPRDILIKQIKFHKPDVVYFFDINILPINEFKIIRKYTKLVVGQIAYPLPPKNEILKQYDLIISSLPHYVSLFKKMGIKSEYLRWCSESSILKKIPKTKRACNVVYVGGFSPYHSKGNKILENVAQKINVDFWGYGTNFLSPTSPIRKSYHGTAWGKKMYTIFNQSKIVINRHINISGKYANNMRMFEATLMGALLITDAKSNISEFFKVGEEVVVYKNASDLIRKIRYYLTHDKEREKIALAGQKRTLRDHTYTVRMAELNKILRKYLKNEV